MIFFIHNIEKIAVKSYVLSDDAYSNLQLGLKGYLLHHPNFTAVGNERHTQ